MNTPPTIKRFKQVPVTGEIPAGAGAFAILNSKIAAEFGMMMAEFEHVENAMPQMLAVLLGGYDANTAGYVLRAIRNPKTKHDLLQHLLEKAPVNHALPETFDQILVEYQRLASQRNRLAHGKWFTSDNEGSPVFVSESSVDGLDFLHAKEIKSERLAKMADEMRALKVWVYTTTNEILTERQRTAKQNPRDQKANP
tara:strand:- start:251 stop:841 length:591 start_codon:yes stop_codon:yes gene_type:complete